MLSLKALGCILYALCYLLHPFQDMGSLGILSAKIKFPEAPVAPEVQTILLRMLDVSTRYLYRVIVKEMIWIALHFILHLHSYRGLPVPVLVPVPLPVSAFKRDSNIMESYCIIHIDIFPSNVTVLHLHFRLIRRQGLL